MSGGEELSRVEAVFHQVCAAPVEERERVLAELTAGDEGLAAEVRSLLAAVDGGELLGRLEALDMDWKLADEYVERIKQVTPEQVRAVASKYLVSDNLTLAVLEPLPLDNSSANSAKGGGYGHHQ